MGSTGLGRWGAGYISLGLAGPREEKLVPAASNQGRGMVTLCANAVSSWLGWSLACSTVSPAPPVMPQGWVDKSSHRYSCPAEKHLDVSFHLTPEVRRGSAMPVPPRAAGALLPQDTGD